MEGGDSKDPYPGTTRLGIEREVPATAVFSRPRIEDPHGKEEATHTCTVLLQAREESAFEDAIPGALGVDLVLKHCGPDLKSKALLGPA